MSAEEAQAVENATDGPAFQSIPGWRLIISDAGRFWALRQRPFPIAATKAGADSAVDADTFDEVRAAVADQERIAGQAVS
ncbi:hypothetical protein ACFQ08_04525 [Streptosporangium algeriense]|uniref:Uncharacterized protein n=1 Tax=Streptosporangium algeriense TaxID=1682748 RepID=A0ABW3DM57_9ACTN